MYSLVIDECICQATAQRFGAATTYSSGFQSGNFAADGLLGMAYKSISNYNANPLFQTLVSQGQASTPIFSFYLAQSGSELYIGGTNQNHYKGSFTYMPVTKQVGIHDDAFGSVLTIIHCRDTGKARSMVFLSTGILLSVARVPSLTPAPPKSSVTPEVYGPSMPKSLARMTPAPEHGPVCL